MASGYLYVIKDQQTSLTKIGITNNWRSRLRTLKVGKKTECKIVVEVNDNREWEKRLHKKYDHWRLVGTEWFNLDAELEKELIRGLVKIGTAIDRNKQDRDLKIEMNKEREEYLKNAAEERANQVARNFTLAYMRGKIMDEWKIKGLNIVPDNSPCIYNKEIFAEAELRYLKGFRVSTSDWGWRKVAPDGKWIECSEHETSF